jgi:hypothetical protein
MAQIAGATWRCQKCGFTSHGGARPVRSIYARAAIAPLKLARASSRANRKRANSATTKAINRNHNNVHVYRRRQHQFSDRQ